MTKITNGMNNTPEIVHKPMFFQDDEGVNQSSLMAPARSNPDLDSPAAVIPGGESGTNGKSKEDPAGAHIPTTELEIAPSYWVRNHTSNQGQKHTLCDSNYVDTTIPQGSKSWFHRGKICLWVAVFMTLLAIGVGSIFYVAIQRTKEGGGQDAYDAAGTSGQGNQEEIEVFEDEVASKSNSPEIIQAYEKLLLLADEYTYHNGSKEDDSPQGKAMFIIKNGVESNTIHLFHYGNHTAEDLFETLAETYTLLVLAYSFGGAKWSVSNSWPSVVEHHYCTWIGISCSSGRPHQGLLSKRVQKIDLNNEALKSGTVPKEIGYLSNLESLEIGKNHLQGSIPTELYQLTNLMKLDLGDNRLDFTISDQIGRFEKLEHLSIRNNYAKGVLPETMGKLTNIRLLDLSNNDLSGPIFDIIQRNTKIEVANLHSNSFDVTIPTEIGQATDLVELQLSQNQIPGTIPTEIGLLSSLKVFTVGHGLSGTLPVEIGQLKSLNTLRVTNNNNVTGTIPPALGKLTFLLDLALSGNNIQGTIPSSLGMLSYIHILSLKNNMLSGSIPTEFARFQNAEHIYLGGNEEVYGKIPKEICKTRYLFYGCSIKCDCCNHPCVI